jgi:hypothetical protein
MKNSKGFVQIEALSFSFKQATALAVTMRTRVLEVANPYRNLAALTNGGVWR